MNLVYLWILLSFCAFYGTSEYVIVSPKEALDTTTHEYRFNENDLFKLDCSLSIQLNNTYTKWFQIKGALHEFKSKDFQLSADDINTEIYCVVVIRNRPPVCEIFTSYKIKLRSLSHVYQETFSKYSFSKNVPSVQLKYTASTTGNANKFDITCTAENMPNPEQTILEVYELKDNVGRLLNDTKGNSITINFMVCDSTTYVFCRAVVNETSDNFYRSEDVHIKPFKPEITCNEAPPSCRISRNDTETTTFNSLISSDTYTSEHTATSVFPEGYKMIDQHNDVNKNKIIIAVATSVACIFIIILISIIIFCIVKRNNKEDLEPKVSYAELLLSESGSQTFIKPQENPYVEIIGVIKQKDNTHTRMKAGTRDAEQPYVYATPYRT